MRLNSAHFGEHSEGAMTGASQRLAATGHLEALWVCSQPVFLLLLLFLFIPRTSHFRQ